MEDFNKRKKTEEIMHALQNTQGKGIWEVFDAISGVAEILQQIHDDAYQKGFDFGIDVNKKMEEL